MAARVCKCGCGESLDGYRKGAVWASDACRMRASRDGRSAGTANPASGPQNPNRTRTHGRSGLQVSYPKAVAVLAAGLDLDPETVSAVLARALSDRQRRQLDTTTVTVAPARRRVDDDRTVAARIAAVHNQLRAAILHGGVLSFSAEGRSVRPLIDDDQWGQPMDRIPFPVADRDVSVAEVEDWLDHHRILQAEAREQQQQQQEAAARREIRAGETARHYGMAAGAVNCESCGAFKPRPSATCGQCGDVPHRGDADAYDIAHGYAPDAARAA